MTAPAANRPGPNPAHKPAFSFAGLSIEPAHVPAIKRDTSAGENPFREVVKATYELPGDEGRRITVPAAAAPQAIYLLRQAASTQGLGLRLALQDKHGNRLDIGSKGGTRTIVNGKAQMRGAKAVVIKSDGSGAEWTGNVILIFKAKDRKERKPAASS